MLDSFSILIGDRPLRVDSKSVKYLAVTSKFYVATIVYFVTHRGMSLFFILDVVGLFEVPSVQPNRDHLHQMDPGQLLGIPMLSVDYCEV